MTDDDYEYVCPMPVRYRDLDPMGHVNNAVYASYMEQARIEYFDDVLDVDLESLSSVIASLEIDYYDSITIDQEVTIALRVSELGGSSIHQEYEFRADGEMAARASSVQVYVDGESRQSQRIPDEWREQIHAFEPGLEAYEG